MDDLTMATTPWTGTERRGSERRMGGYEFGGAERRIGSDRRSSIALSAPTHPTLGFSDTDTLGARDVTHPRGGHEHDAIPSVAATLVMASAAVAQSPASIARLTSGTCSYASLNICTLKAPEIARAAEAL